MLSSQPGHDLSEMLAINADRAYRATCDALASGSPIDSLSRLLMHRSHSLSMQLDGLDGPSGAPVCSGGCSTCCHQAILCAPLEALLLAGALHETLEAGSLADLKARVAKAVSLDSGTPLNLRFWACPLLSSDGLCTAYELRPSVCITHHSVSLNSCRTAHVARLNGTDPGSSIPGYELPELTASAIRAGIDGAIAMRGLQVAPVELNAALSIALEGPFGVMTRWLAGERVFPRPHSSLPDLLEERTWTTTALSILADLGVIERGYCLSPPPNPANEQLPTAVDTVGRGGHVS